MKKLLLSLGSVAAAIAPVTAVIACGKTDEATKLFNKLGIKLGKQETTGFALEFKADNANKIAAGTYYFKADELALNKQIKVASTTAGETTTLKVTTAIEAAGNVGASVSTTAGTQVALTAQNVVATAGAADAFFVTEGEFTRPAANASAVATVLQDTLKAKAPASLYESKTAVVKKAVNKLLKEIGKEITDDKAFEFTAPTIAFAGTLDTTAATKEASVKTFGLTIDKQTTAGFVLTFAADTDQKIAAGKYYFKADELAANKEITVASTTAGETTTLKVETAIDDAAADVKAKLKTTGSTPVAVTEAVKAENGVATKFFAENANDKIAKLALDDKAKVQAEIKTVVDALLAKNYIKASELIDPINQLLIATGEKLNTNGSNLTFTEPAVTIDDSKIVAIA